MSTKNFLFLHIGCGKTGSSAIQLWLHENSETFKKHGVYYPTFGQKNLHDYSITSGNGVHLVSELRKGNIVSLIARNTKEFQGNLFYSSEVFQNLQEHEIQELEKTARQFNYEIIIIAYVRDVYDIVYSSYLQLVKRHLFSDTFSNFVRTRKTLQQFTVIKKFELYFNSIKLIHYESEKDHGLEKPLCNIIGVDYSAIPLMKKNKVNRSLTINESELMKIINELYKENFSRDNFTFCSKISDGLIYNNPEKETEIFVNKNLIKYLEKTMNHEIIRINDKYFQSNTLKVFDQAGKNIVHNIKTAHLEDAKTILQLLIKNTESFKT